MGPKGLLVDDDSQILSLLTKYFRKHGIDTYSTGNGNAALDLLNSKKIHFLLTDINMPQMDGYQLARQVQSKYPNLPIYFMTGNSNSIKKDENSLKIKHIFHKPFDFEEFKIIFQNSTPFNSE